MNIFISGFKRPQNDPYNDVIEIDNSITTINDVWKIEEQVSKGNDFSFTLMYWKEL